MAEVEIKIHIENNAPQAFKDIAAAADKLRSAMESLNRTGKVLSENVVQVVSSLNNRINELAASMNRLTEEMKSSSSSSAQQKILMLELAQVIIGLISAWSGVSRIYNMLSRLGPKLRSFFSAFKIPAGAASRIKDLFSVIGNFTSSVLGRLAGAARSIGAFFSSFRLPAGLAVRMRGLFTLVGGFFRLLLPRLLFLARFLGPVGLIVTAFFAGWKIGKLVGELEVGGVKIKDWVERMFVFLAETFKKIPMHAKNMWAELKLKFQEGMGALTGYVREKVGAFSASVSEAGRNLIATLSEGMKSAPGVLYDTLRDLLGPLGRLLPHSDAEEGPLSRLSEAGKAIPAAIAEGMGQGEGLRGAMETHGTTVVNELRNWMNRARDTSAEIGRLLTGTFDMVADGMGSAVAQAVVYGKSLGEGLKNVMKSVGAFIIQTLVRIGVQRVIAAILGKTLGMAEHVARMSQLSAQTYAGAFAATASIPMVGPFMAPGAAAGAVSAMLAGSTAAATAGGTVATAQGAAHGGMDYVPREETYLLDRGERVLSPRQNRDLTEFLERQRPGGEGETYVIREMKVMVNDYDDFVRKLAPYVKKHAVRDRVDFGFEVAR